MKNPADKRKKISENVLKNENTNLRIKKLLQEFSNPEFEIENVRPNSPSQQDLLRIYEEGVWSSVSNDEIGAEIKPIIEKLSVMDKEKMPTRSEFLKYKIWLQQKYRSPYTGENIQLSRLFTADYEIEHIIPQSKYFDDSFSNKVICESEVNKKKGSQLGMEFIKKHHGEIVTLSGGKTVKILEVSKYQNLVQTTFKNDRTKMKKLLMDEIPDGFIERQLNDSRYISKFIKGILSNLVREKDENGNLEDSAVSKNLISCNGSITDRLKKDWGMSDVWNSIILPRFMRMNEISKTEIFVTKNTQGHEIPNMPIEFQKGFNKKRIDHRHHAMDALVIACTTRDHVNLLNNISAMSKHKENRLALSNKLRKKEKIIVNGEEKKVCGDFIKPWETFTEDAKKALLNIIVSFKQNLRVINKTSNYYETYKKENGELNLDKNDKPKKTIQKQTKGDSWAIRKSLHKDTIRGLVNLKREEKISLKQALKNPENIVEKDVKNKIKEFRGQKLSDKDILNYFKEHEDEFPETKGGKVLVYYFTEDKNEHCYATRFLNDLVSIFKDCKDDKKAKDIIESITDAAIQKILLKHLEQNDNDPQKAFSADGIDRMNDNLGSLNNGKQHKSIYKVRRYEESSLKFSLGKEGINSKKFAEADKGTNLFFVVIKKDNKRQFATIPLNDVIDCQKKFGANWKKNFEIYLKDMNKIDSDSKYLFTLSPLDLVYLPTQEEINSGKLSISNDRIYKVVSLNGPQCFFIKENVATSIINKEEFTSLNKMERAITGEMIKENCIPIKVDRLGKIIEIWSEK